MGEIIHRWLKAGYFSGVLWGLGLLAAALVLPRIMLNTPKIRDYLWPDDVKVMAALHAETEAKKAELAQLKQRAAAARARPGPAKKRFKKRA